MIQDKYDINADFIIYVPAKNPMQSVIEEEMILVELNNSESCSSMVFSPVTKWTGSRSSKKQIRLHFSSLEGAIKYLNQKSLSYLIRVKKSQKSKVLKKKSYISNFLSNE